MQTETTFLPPQAAAVSKERKKSDDRQVSFRVQGEMYARLEAAASGLSLDVSSLLRTMIRKHLPEYERAAEDIRRLEREGGAS